MEPAKKWLLWTRWLLLMGLMVLVFPVLIRFFLQMDNGEDAWMGWTGTGMVSALTLYLLISLKPIKQRVALVCDDKTVDLILSMNFFRQIEMRSFDGRTSGVKTLGHYHGLPIWFETTIDIGGKPQSLLLYFRFPNGFLVTPRRSTSAITITRNEICF